MFHPRKNFGHERPLNPFNIHDSSIKTSVTSLVKIKKSLIKTLSPWAVRQCTNATQFELYRNKQKILLVYLYCLFFVLFFVFYFYQIKRKKNKKEWKFCKCTEHPLTEFTRLLDIDRHCVEA